MSIAVQTQDVLLNGELISRNGGIADITAFVDGDVYYARIGRDGIADVFSAPANVLSLEERLRQDFGGRSSAKTRRKGRCKSRRRRSLK